MGFISFNENYYRRKLEDYENRLLSDADIYEAKQLLKVLDDLADEGYTNLNDQMEAHFSCGQIYYQNRKNGIPEDHLIKVNSSESLVSGFLSSLMHLYVKADYCLYKL